MVCRIPHPYGSINLPNIPISGAQDTVFTVLCHRASNPPYQLDSHQIITFASHHSIVSQNRVCWLCKTVLAFYMISRIVTASYNLLACLGRQLIPLVFRALVTFGGGVDPFLTVHHNLRVTIIRTLLFEQTQVI